MKITNNEFLVSSNDEKKRIDVFLNKKLKKVLFDECNWTNPSW